MPTLNHTMPVPPTWNGRPDPLGGAADGMMVETSHVTIQGLKILGLPVVESPKPGVIRRLYAISRLRRDLEDLEIAQCLFAGDEVTNPNHVAIIANGSGVNVHHCIFRGLKISVVYWTPRSSGHAMTNGLCHDLYGSAVWTSGVANDFDYRNNVVANCNYVWTSQGGSSALADAGGRGGRPRNIREPQAVARPSRAGSIQRLSTQENIHRTQVGITSSVDANPSACRNRGYSEGQRRRRLASSWSPARFPLIRASFFARVQRLIWASRLRAEGQDP